MFLFDFEVSLEFFSDSVHLIIKWFQNIMVPTSPLMYSQIHVSIYLSMMAVHSRGRLSWYLRGNMVRPPYKQQVVCLNVCDTTSLNRPRTELLEARPDRHGNQGCGVTTHQKIRSVNPPLTKRFTNCVPEIKT